MCKQFFNNNRKPAILNIHRKRAAITVFITAILKNFNVDHSGKSLTSRHTTVPNLRPLHKMISCIIPLNAVKPKTLRKTIHQTILTKTSETHRNPLRR